MAYDPYKPKPGGGATTTTAPSGPAPAIKGYDPYGGGGGGGGTSGGSGGSSGGTTSKGPTYNKKGIGKPAKTSSFDIEGELIRQASKLAALGTTHPKRQATIDRFLRENLAGYSVADINRMAQKAGIPEGVATVLRGRLGGSSSHGYNAAGTVLDYVGRPAQAVEGGFSEASPGQIFSPQGALKGLTGQETYTPIQTVARSLGGQSKLKAKKTEAGLNPVVRVAGNLGLGVAFDPLTYVSFGTTAGSKAGVDAAAEIVATERVARAADAGQVLSKADTAATIRDAIRSVGAKKALGEDYKILGPKVQRALRGAQGGVKVAGKTVVPGKVFENKALAGLRDNLLGSRASNAVEEVTRTLPKIREAERAGQVGAGTTEDIAAAIRRAQSATAVSNEDWLRLSKAGAKVSDPAVRAKLVTALEDPNTVASLSKSERKAFDVLDQIRYEKTAALQESGRLRGNMPTAAAAGAPNLDAEARAVMGEWVQAAQSGDKVAAAKLKLPPDQILNNALEEAKSRAGQLSAAPEGSFVGGAVPPMSTDRYFPRVLSEQSKKAGMKVETPSPVALTASTPGFARGRLAETRFTPTPDLIDKSTGLPRFETDPFVATYKHAAGVNADVARTRFIEDMRQIPGTDKAPIIQVPSDMGGEVSAAVEKARVNDVINGRVVKEVPIRTVDKATGETGLATQKVLVDPILAHDPAFDRVMKVFANPSHAQDLKNFYSKAMQLWKGYATTFGPFSGGFGLRNFLGNQLNGYFLTGTSPTWQFTAERMLSKLAKGAKDGDPYKYLTASQATEAREAFSTGVLGHGFYAEDTGARNLVDKLRSQAGQSVTKKVAGQINPVSLDNFLLRHGRNFNSRIEDTARLGLFLAKRRGGFTPDTASRLVQKFLFDYGELSTADRAIKQVIPFWTWTRKNLPLQLEVLAKTPGAASAQAHVLDALRSLAPNYDQAALPQWAQQSDAVVMPGGKSAYVPDLPITSINDQLKPLFDLWKMRQSGPKDYKTFFRDLALAAQPSGPLAGATSVFTQQALGQDLFSGRQFKPGDTTGPLPSQIEQPLEQLAPFGPGIAKIRGIADSSKRDQKLLSGLTGIQTTPVNKKTKTSEQFRRADELKRLVDWLRSQGVRLPTLDYIPTKDRKVSK